MSSLAVWLDGPNCTRLGRISPTPGRRSCINSVSVWRSWRRCVLTADRGFIRFVRCCTETGLFAFVVPSPKRDDLVRDGRYSLHSFPADENEDAFYASGRAVLVSDPQLRDDLADRYVRERKSLHITREALSDDVPFEFDISTCLVTRTEGHGDGAPKHAIWHAG